MHTCTNPPIQPEKAELKTVFICFQNKNNLFLAAMASLPHTHENTRLRLEESRQLCACVRVCCNITYRPFRTCPTVARSLVSQLAQTHEIWLPRKKQETIRASSNRLEESPPPTMATTAATIIPEISTWLLLEKARIMI